MDTGGTGSLSSAFMPDRELKALGGLAGAGYIRMLNHPVVYEHLREWLSEPAGADVEALAEELLQ